MPRLNIVANYLQNMLTTSDPIRRFQLSLLGLFLLTIFGTVVYIVLEGMAWVDALYMTVITIATVGFGEVKELSPQGRVFTIFLILMGVGTATAAISNAVSIVLGPLLWSSLEQRRMKQMVQSLNHHYIVCGYGRMGRQIASDLQVRGEKYVVLDANPDMEATFLEHKIPYIIGSAMEDDMLIEAGIERARGLVSALSSDAGNVMTVLTARELNPKVYVVARVVRRENESKLRRAGANEVINPYQIGGHRMALSLLRPAVHDFLTHIFNFGDKQHAVDVGQLRVNPNSPLEGKTIATCGIRNDYGVNVLGIIQPDGELDITPSPHTELRAGAVLIVIGEPQAIYKIEETGLEA